MQSLKPLKFASAVVTAASIPALLAVAAYAQTTPPPTPEAPSSTQQSPVTAPQPGTPTAVPEKMAPSAQDATKVTPGNAPTAGAGLNTPQLPEVKDVAVGAPVFGSDGQKVGEVKEVKAEANGVVSSIHVETGGFLGFGTKMIAVSADKISKGGKNIELAVTSSDFEKLPQVADTRS